MKLFSAFSLRGIPLQNRIVMAPMTRSRATDNIPGPLMAEYYGQRASAGLIITEGTSPSPNGLGYARIPGIFTPEQRTGWRRVTDEVHAREGRIFLQIMHTGRVGSLVNLKTGAEIIGPSAIPLAGKVWSDVKGEVPYDVPRTMTEHDIAVAVAEYARAAEFAIEAGFDGVEIHGANGYLITQFLDPGSNNRDDGYGGDATCRNRFALDVARAVVDTIGSARTGIRLSPYGVFNDMSGAYLGIAEQYTELVAGLGALELAYLHLVDHSDMGAPEPDRVVMSALCEAFRNTGGGTIILSGGYTPERATADLERGAADLVAFGRPFIANPDLVQRFRAGASLAAADQATFYTPGREGYTDYPALVE
ncbi:alkene reductase [Geomonas limicola]|uniref:Alkene reductase n=1 Tax=Geomonas limicola TaxID=2740186 RepID=A0A6V8N2L3_9BACT|nr:alkene reductase [Geomonas limicola]GFO66661.1 alkene reductase [Geomonas limicola]